MQLLGLTVLGHSSKCTNQMVTQMENLVWYHSLDEGYQSIGGLLIDVTSETLYDSVVLSKGTGVVQSSSVDGDQWKTEKNRTDLWIL